jgi:hypothetical protein
VYLSAVVHCNFFVQTPLTTAMLLSQLDVGQWVHSRTRVQWSSARAWIFHTPLVPLTVQRYVHLYSSVPLIPVLNKVIYIIIPHVNFLLYSLMWPHMVLFRSIIQEMNITQSIIFCNIPQGRFIYIDLIQCNVLVLSLDLWIDSSKFKAGQIHFTNSSEYGFLETYAFGLFIIYVFQFNCVGNYKLIKTLSNPFLEPTSI